MKSNKQFASLFEILVFTKLYNISVHVYQLMNDVKIEILAIYNTDGSHSFDNEHVNLLFSGSFKTGHFEVLKLIPIEKSQSYVIKKFINASSKKPEDLTNRIVIEPEEIPEINIKIKRDCNKFISDLSDVDNYILINNFEPFDINSKENIKDNTLTKPQGTINIDENAIEFNCDTNVTFDFSLFSNKFKFCDFEPLEENEIDDESNIKLNCFIGGYIQQIENDINKEFSEDSNDSSHSITTLRSRISSTDDDSSSCCESNNDDHSENKNSDKSNELSCNDNEDSDIYVKKK